VWLVADFFRSEFGPTVSSQQHGSRKHIIHSTLTGAGSPLLSPATVSSLPEYIDGQFPLSAGIV
jgi:hypothetical protein